mgnify:CR=1 FL=1
MSEVFMVIAALLGIIGLLFLTFYLTKWLNKKFRNTGWNGGQNGIKIIECMGIAQDKQLLVVKVGCRSMLLGVTPNSVTKLSDLDENDMALLEENNQNSSGFADTFKNAFANKFAQGDSTAQEEDHGRNENDIN